MKRILAVLLVALMLAVAIPAHAKRPAEPTTCYDPNGSVDGTNSLDPTEDPWQKGLTFSCDFFSNDVMLLPNPTLVVCEVVCVGPGQWGSPDLNNDGHGELDSVADDVYPEAGSGDVFVLLGTQSDDDFDIAYFDERGNSVAFANHKEGSDYGNSGGDEIGTVPLDASYAIVKLWLGSGTGANAEYDFFELSAN